MLTSLILFAAWKIIVFLFLAFIYVVSFAFAGLVLLIIATGTDGEVKMVNPKATIFFGVPIVILTLACFSLIWRSSDGARTELLQGYAEFVKEDTPVTELDNGTEIQRFTLVSITPPKQVYITLKGQDGKLYENIYVSKHCAVMPEVGKEYNIPLAKYSLSDAPLAVMVRWPNLNHIFCQE